MAPGANIGEGRHLRSGARLGAGHRRQEHRQPHLVILASIQMLEYLGMQDKAERSARRCGRPSSPAIG
jgi:isocitrate dehydrogenase (NAD+)